MYLLVLGVLFKGHYWGFIIDESNNTKVLKNTTYKEAISLFSLPKLGDGLIPQHSWRTKESRNGGLYSCYSWVRNERQLYKKAPHS
jgi:hypothetical protein